jgi:ATP-dependent RNA helicase DeaD
MTEFDGVYPALGQALTKRGYTELTPVQKAVLGDELENADLLVSAQTGSGKTVAFGLAMAATLFEGKQSFGKARVPLALVIAPTRELALQVRRELEWLYQISGAGVISCVGGMDIRAERRALEKGPHIVVGTPGRLRDHIERGYFDTSGLKVAVLDEADEMLDMGFRDELEYILGTSPEERRTWMFSATVPKSIQSLARRYQKDAVRVTTKEEKEQHIDIEYPALTIAPSDRENAIINTLRFHEAKNTIVFCGTRAAVNHLTSRLNNRGFSVVSISGELSQNERSQALQSLRDGRAKVCVATDVAARGIDLPGLELVIHADLPKNKDLLLHRSGRTGRAGRKGTSALIVPYNQRSRTDRMLQNANVNAVWSEPASIEDVMARDRERFLADPALSVPVKEEEKAFAAELVERYGAEQIATALLRMHNTQKPAPEELLGAKASDKKKKKQDNFKNGVWVSLSVGHDVNAAPRWIMPMMCSAGQLTKRQIGSIRILDKETHVELSPECVDKFFEIIGPSCKVEDNVVATRMEGVPAAPAESKAPRRDRDSRPPRRSGGGGKPDGKYGDKKKSYGGSKDGSKSYGGSRDGNKSGGYKSENGFKSEGRSKPEGKGYKDSKPSEYSRDKKPSADAPREVGPFGAPVKRKFKKKDMERETREGLGQEGGYSQDKPKKKKKKIVNKDKGKPKRKNKEGSAGAAE